MFYKFAIGGGTSSGVALAIGVVLVTAFAWNALLLIAFPIAVLAVTALVYGFVKMVQAIARASRPEPPMIQHNIVAPGCKIELERSPSSYAKLASRADLKPFLVQINATPKREALVLTRMTSHTNEPVASAEGATREPSQANTNAAHVETRQSAENHANSNKLYPDLSELKQDPCAQASTPTAAPAYQQPAQGGYFGNPAANGPRMPMQHPDPNHPWNQQPYEGLRPPNWNNQRFHTPMGQPPVAQPFEQPARNPYVSAYA